MNDKQIKFNQECPAWARAMGITTLAEWKVASEVVPFSWPMRFDRLAELEADAKITGEAKARIVQVLENWDDGSLGLSRS